MKSGVSRISSSRLSRATLQPYLQAAGGADGGHIPIITSNRSSSRPPRSPSTTGRCLTRIQRARKPIRLGCMNIRSLPALYVFNAAALSKPHAVQHLAADLVSTGASVAVITETHFKQKHTDSAVGVDDFTLFRRDRTGRRGGGVAVYVNSSVWSPRHR